MKCANCGLPIQKMKKTGTRYNPKQTHQHVNSAFSTCVYANKPKGMFDDRDFIQAFKYFNKDGRALLASRRKGLAAVEMYTGRATFPYTIQMAQDRANKMNHVLGNVT